MSDMRSVNNSKSGAADEYVEQIRQKIGTEFSDRKASGKKRNEMGKDDFVKLMSAQLKHQDPLSQLKNEQMAAQLAQFSALEQMVNMNTNLEKMTAAQKPQENVMAASLIGKKIMTDSSKFAYEKGNQPEVKFELPADASTVNLSMVDAKGEIIREYELGSMKKGDQSLRWDGKSGKGLDMNNGEYSFKVSAVDTEGRPMQIQTSSAGLVTGVSFEGGKAMLLVGDRRIPMEAVGRIEADMPGASPAPAAAPAKNLSPAKPEEKTTQGVKNSLPPELDAEKIKAMLGSLGGSSRMEMDPSGGAGESESPLPMPLWNPSNL
jgi:flagellar basal-body rod modification protein FlgD